MMVSRVDKDHSGQIAGKELQDALSNGKFRGRQHFGHVRHAGMHHYTHSHR